MADAENAAVVEPLAKTASATFYSSEALLEPTNLTNPPLIHRRAFEPIDDEHFNGRALRVELQAELLLQRGEQ